MIFTVVNVDVETVMNVDAESLRATREPHALPLRSLKPERAALTTDPGMAPTEFNLKDIRGTDEEKAAAADPGAVQARPAAILGRKDRRAVQVAAALPLRRGSLPVPLRHGRAGERLLHCRGHRRPEAPPRAHHAEAAPPGRDEPDMARSRPGRREPPDEHRGSGSSTRGEWAGRPHEEKGKGLISEPGLSRYAN